MERNFHKCDSVKSVEHLLFCYVRFRKEETKPQNLPQDYSGNKCIFSKTPIHTSSFSLQYTLFRWFYSIGLDYDGPWPTSCKASGQFSTLILFLLPALFNRAGHVLLETFLNRSNNSKFFWFFLPSQQWLLQSVAGSSSSSPTFKWWNSTRSWY